jgi:hypothetical protein
MAEQANVEQIAARLEALKGRLGQDSKNLGPEIDQIVQQLRQMEQSQQSSKR